MFHISHMTLFGIITAALAVLLSLAGCGTSSDGGSVLRSAGAECIAEKATPFRDDLTVAQADSMVRANEGRDCFSILDVRTSDEYNAGHIPGAHKYDINTDEFATALGTLNKDTLYLVYCRSGGRSARAANQMRDAGFTAVFNMLGGFNDWTEAEYPVEK